MAEEFNWIKPTITVKEINSILHSQYGPECPTRLLFEDETKPIPYKTALINCECMRCGRQFTMTPYALVNSIYFNGYVCTKCGSLSDDELKSIQEENMRVKGIELLKEHGVDVVKEAIDDMNKKDGKSSETEEDFDSDEIDMDDVDLSVNEDVDVQSEEIVRPDDNPELADEEISQESSSPDVDDDMSKYMASDEDYASSISDNSDDFEDTGDDESDVEDEFENDGGIYEEDNDSSEETEVMTIEEIEAEKAKAVELAKEEAEAEKQKAVEEAKQEAMREAQKKADEDKAAYADKIRAEMEAKMKAEIEAEKAKAAAEIEAAKKAREEAEKFAAEANLKAQEAQEALEALEDDKEPESPVTEEPSPTNDEDENISDEDAVLGTEELKAKDEAVIWIGDECYAEEELSEKIQKTMHSMVDKMKYLPYDVDSFECKNGKLYAKCKTCHNEVSFDSYEDFEKIYTLKDFASRYGLNFTDYHNNLSGKDTLVVNCPCCTESLHREGRNVYHEKTVKSIANRSHFTINDKRHLFIHDANEEFECSCNGVTKTLSYTDIITRYCGKNSGKDAREDDIFKPTAENKSTESSKPTQQEKPYVLKPRSMDSKIKEDNVSSTASGTTETEQPKAKKGNIFNVKTEYDAATFNTDKAKDSFSDFEFERKRKERNEERKSIFVKSPELKTSKNEVAKLNGKINPFEREKSLTQEFEETVFCDFIEQLSAQTGVDYKLIVNENSYEIPVVDFESGIRIICSNLDDSNFYNVKYEWINPRVPFSFFEQTAEDDGTGVLKRKRKKYRWIVLFSDSVTFAKEATFEALVKYINPSILAYEGKRIVLQDNFIFQYTKNDQYIRDFDKRYSTFPSRKPSNGHVGIIARWSSSAQATTKDVLKFRMQMENKNAHVNNLDSLASDYNEFMVASIKYIESTNKETGRIIYTITEYLEVGSSIIADGFMQCIRALLKEYLIKYPQLSSVAPHIVVDVDNNLFPSPSLITCIERGELCKLDNTFRSIIEGTRCVQQGVNRELRYSYVRRPEYRGSKDIDYMRQDKRMFNTGSLITRMADEIKQAGLANTIRNPETRNQFIQNMGYVEATQVEVKQYFVNQTTVNAMMTDGLTYSMTERVDENMFNSAKMVSDSNVGLGMNNVMMNPNLMARYANIMNGSAEAKDLYQRIIRDEYQQKMMDMMMHVSQQNGNGNIFNPAMNGGMNMNPMMNPMMGMGMGMMGGMNMMPGMM